MIQSPNLFRYLIKNKLMNRPFVLFLFSIFLISSSRQIPAAKPSLTIIYSGQGVWSVREKPLRNFENEPRLLLGDDTIEPRFIVSDIADVLIVQVHRGSILYQAGLQSGDHIITINGYELENTWSAVNILNEMIADEKRVEVGLVRRGKIIFQVYIFEGDSLKILRRILMGELLNILSPFHE